MKTTAKLSSKSQITIPAWVRRRLGLAPGSVVVLRVDGCRLVVDSVDEAIRSLQGALRGVYGDPDRYVRELRAESDRFPLE